MGERRTYTNVAWFGSLSLAAVLTAPAAHATPGGDWHLSTIGAESAWHTATGSGVTVAVIDSGVDADHPDLDGAVLPGRSYVDQDQHEQPRLLALGADTDESDTEALAQDDPVGHGTAVAGLVAGRAASGRPGVAPGATVLPVRVLDDENRYHDSAMVGEAVEWAVDNDADVVNLSLGGHYESAALAEAIDYAERHDVVVVACTGNQKTASAGESVWFPARDPDVLAVTGVDRSGARWPTAVSGDRTDLAAPGVELAAARAGGGHKVVTGTSFAAAVVSGAAALVRSAHPELSAAEVRTALTATADDSGGGGERGAGVVDAAAAVAADAESMAAPVSRPAVAEVDWHVRPLMTAVSTVGVLATAVLVMWWRRAHRPG